MALQQLAERPQPKYSCPAVELYAGLPIVWNTQAQYETEFGDDNTQYTPGLSVTRKAAITAAQAMPDGQATGAISEELRILLEAKLDLVLTKWQTLDSYIGKAYKGNLYKPKIEEAGKQYYAKAAHENWEYAKQLLASGKTFLTNYGAVLLADGGMPAGFEAGYTTLQGEYTTLFESFKAAQEESQMQTDAKINANNAIYADGRSMMEDGKRIFKKNASLRDRFIWERILESLTPNSSSTVVFENDINMGVIDSHDLEDLNPTDDTMVLVEVTGNDLIISANNVDGPVMGPTQWVAVVGGQVKPIAEFAALIGASDINHFMKVTWPGPGTGSAHYKIRFTHLG
jgi:hypothetical protein